MAKAADGVTTADRLARALAARGVDRIFGIPGGESSLDVIDSAHRAGIEFVLARREDSAAMMASAYGECRHTLGVVLTTRGPGIASAVDGVAYAALDRAPLLVIGDGFEDGDASVSYQRFDQAGLLAPLVKRATRCVVGTPFAEIERLLDLALALPMGPVYLEMTASGARSVDATPPGAAPSSMESAALHIDKAAIEAARRAISQSQRTVIIVGLQARARAAVDAVRALVDRLQCPVFTTWKGKGVIPDDDPRCVGHLLGGPGEDAILSRADRIVAIGLDPIEIAPKPWPHRAPVLELLTHPFERRPFIADLSLYGDIVECLRAITPAAHRGTWESTEIEQVKRSLRERALLGQQDTTRAASPGHRQPLRAISPQAVIEAVSHVAAGAVITVDSGAHMIAAMTLLQAREPGDVLISKGLATMAFSLPAAIGASLAHPRRHVVALIGDGGLAMCSGELATLAALGCNATVVVFNDSNLSLIDIKQRRRGLPRRGVETPSVDYAHVADGFGCRGYRVERGEELVAVLADALRRGGPSLVDVVVDPGSYHQHVAALRG